MLTCALSLVSIIYIRENIYDTSILLIEKSTHVLIFLFTDLAPKQENGSYSAEVLNKISELVNPNTICLAKIVDFDSEGNYKIELPDVRDKLIKESLIPPY